MKKNSTMKIHKTTSRLHGVLAAAVGCLLSLNAFAPSPPDFMNYQGYLLDSNGAPLANSAPQNFTIQFRIYAGSSGGSALWGESQIVTVSRGSFSVVLGEGSTISGTSHTSLANLFNNSTDRYIGITVVGQGSEITPRLRLLPSPFSFYASHAERAANADAAMTATTATTANNATHLGSHAASDYVRKSASSTITDHVTINDGITVNKGGRNALTFDNSRHATFGAGVTATSFSGHGTIPIGGIIMWSGSTANVPAGWALCNGQRSNGHLTPNLQNRFVVGAGSTYTPHYTGGSSTRTLSTSNLPSHQHSVSDAYFAENTTFSTKHHAITTMGPANYPGARGGHDNDNKLAIRSTDTGQTGSGHSFSILPPYYALAYIMRVQ